MDASAKKLLTELKNKKYSPVYLLQGEETYYIDLISNYIEANTLSESEKGFNQVVIYGKESPVNVILNHAKRFPMMAERQVVIVREAQEIPDLAKEMGQKLLLDYFSRPVPSTILVLCHKYKTLDKRKELGKKADQLTNSSTFKKPYETQLPEFVAEYIKSKGSVMEDDGIAILCESVGNDLNRLTNEVDKMLTGKSEGQPVTADDVMAQVGMSREYNIFELQKALIAQDTFKTFQIAEYFAANTRKNPLIMLVAFLFSFYSKLLLAAGNSGSSEKELVSILKISPFAARDYMNALRKYSLPKIIENISLLKEADLKLKGVNSGSEDEGQILKELVMRLIH
ncbi:MAG: DNA polymerase III subunit delta [Cyclobacteriaceae bacterium]|nr:DNA polymerase III subunit delta [Cyclobacteriaceae bacterium]